ncbi:hypothetical protein QS460_05365 [Liquorilactobacillus mali]|nr:hypothetical protein [Liquorilactobacillus mali]MDN7145354.1 hypothetical protein [Liquorilactobacillus mali]
MLEKIHEYLAVPEGVQGFWFDVFLGYMFIMTVAGVIVSFI